MLDHRDIEEIKGIFQPKEEIVTKLPEKKDIPENKVFLLKSGNTYTEKKLIEGDWCTGQTFTKGE